MRTPDVTKWLFLVRDVVHNWANTWNALSNAKVRCFNDVERPPGRHYLCITYNWMTTNRQMITRGLHNSLLEVCVTAHRRLRRVEIIGLILCIKQWDSMSDICEHQFERVLQKLCDGPIVHVWIYLNIFIFSSGTWVATQLFASVALYLQTSMLLLRYYFVLYI
jgi:hypothetical protein